MPFASHLNELRRRLIYTALFFFVAFSAVFAWGATHIVNYIKEIAVVTHHVNGREVTEQIKFSIIGTMETFSTTMRVSVYAAIVLTYPFAMFQAWRFVAPGLYRNERQFFLFAIPSIFLLFAAGAAFGRYVLLPISIPFLMSFNVEELDVQQLFTLREFLDLVFALTFGLGLIFQLPLLVAPLIRFGLLKPDFFARKRRYTLLASVVVGAVISPSGSPIDMVIAGLPVFFLVEGGVWLGRLWRAAALRRAERLAREAQARGEKVDVESLAGGLAMDLEEKLRKFASGGAREFAREMFTGFREGMKEAGVFNPKTLFDDDYPDDARPAVEVKLKTQPRRKRPAPEAPKAVEPAAAAADPFEPAATSAAALAPAQALAAPEPVPAVAAPAPQAAQARTLEESLPPDLALFIDNRIAVRLDEMFEERIKPFLERALREGRNGNGHTPPSESES